ncbi:hypothetical protein [Streptomyces sp. NPDC049813]|uniref:hypothetical protein n=1 Tax=Streptomyces sp. NPDC049813 TaxID=3365597 RepID=UPI0037873084
MARSAAVASTAVVLAGVLSAGSAAGSAQAHPRSAADVLHLGGLITYSVEFSNPQENDDNKLPEPYGRILVQDDSHHTTLWERPDRGLQTPTLPRYPWVGAALRYVGHPLDEVCAYVGEDDTGYNVDDVLADGCVPFHGPDAYTIPGPHGDVTVTVHHIL